MKKQLLTTCILLATSLPAFAAEPDMNRLNAFAKKMVETKIRP